MVSLQSGLMPSANPYPLIIFNVPGTWPSHVPIIQNSKLMPRVQCWQAIASVCDTKILENRKNVKLNQACQLDRTTHIRHCNRSVLIMIRPLCLARFHACRALLAQCIVTVAPGKGAVACLGVV